MNVKTIADPLRQSASPSFNAVTRLTVRWRLSDFFELSKPRVMLLAVFTAVVGLACARGELDALQALVAVLAIAAGAGASGALNMWYDADIDRLMARTAMRPIPRGRVSKNEALIFGVALAGVAVSALALVTNLTAAALLAGTILFYAVVYTAWLKRSTPQNIVIGGAAGALPPVIGWAAATGEIRLESFTLFLIIFLWTPAHFWALALNRNEEYARAGIPMLPVVAGWRATTRRILVYSALLVVASQLPFVLGFAGIAYGAIAAICGAIFLLFAVRLNSSPAHDRRAAQRLFTFSISYLFVLFAALLIGQGCNSYSSRHADRGWIHAELLHGAAYSTVPSLNIGTGEV